MVKLSSPLSDYHSFGMFPGQPEKLDFVLDGGKWGTSAAAGTWGGIIRWSIVGAGVVNQSGDPGFFQGTTGAMQSTFNFAYEAAIRAAFAAWSQVANITFMQVADDGAAIGLGNASEIRLALAAIDGNSNTLGSAYLPQDVSTLMQDPLSGDIVLDMQEVGFWDYQSLYLVVLHELGHALGLSHENSVDAVMQAFYDPAQFGTGPNGNGLQVDDIAGIQAIYGGAIGGETFLALANTDVSFLYFHSTANRLVITGNGLNNNIIGLSESDVIIGGAGSDALRGGEANDTIYGDFRAINPSGISLGSGLLIKPSSLENSSFLNSISISDLFSLSSNPDFDSSVITPHVTVNGTGQGEVDYYRVQINNAGSIITIDLDHVSSFDAKVRIVNASGLKILAENDDAPADFGAAGSAFSQDSYLMFSVPVAGIYYILVGAYDHTGLGVIPHGSQYALNVSVAGEMNVGGDSDTLNGDAGSDFLFGGEGSDILDGGTGSDTMTGDAGNDTYFIDNIGDAIYENSAEGDSDVAYITVSGYTLSPGVHLEFMVAVSSDVMLSGNDMNNQIFGSNGHDIFSGESGDDFVIAYAGNDSVYGGDGNDQLDGGIGSDFMHGGRGNDLFIVDNINDIVEENINEGIDYILTTSNFQLLMESEVEQIIVNTITGLVISGSNSANQLIGNIGADNLRGGAGRDYILGYSGDDLIEGGDDDDYIDGGFGSDVMAGGLGNDFYIVSSIGDIVVEAIDEGNDVIYAQGDVDISSSATSVEQVVINVAVGLSVIGNGNSDQIIGNNGDDALFGGGGNDLLLAFGGRDTLNGGADSDYLDGGFDDDVLVGGNGGDILIGGAGNDMMTGGEDGDQFLFGPGFGTDVIADFLVNADKLYFVGVFSSAATALAACTQSDSNVVCVSGADSVTLQNTSLSSIDIAIFIIA